MAKPTAPIHLAGPRPDKPRIYNRPWHLDADDRRHHGKRRWNVALLESLLAAAARIESLYPPDFSARNVIRLRAAGIARPVATISTASGASLTVTIGEHKVSLKTRADVRRCVLLLAKVTSAAPGRRSAPHPE
jgi:hypothetical protein